jgi:hypothetical protein
MFTLIRFYEVFNAFLWGSLKSLTLGGYLKNTIGNHTLPFEGKGRDVNWENQDFFLQYIGKNHVLILESKDF